MIKKLKTLKIVFKTKIRYKAIRTTYIEKDIKPNVGKEEKQLKFSGKVWQFPVGKHTPILRSRTNKWVCPQIPIQELIHKNQNLEIIQNINQQKNGQTNYSAII